MHALRCAPGTVFIRSSINSVPFLWNSSQIHNGHLAWVGGEVGVGPHEWGGSDLATWFGGKHKQSPKFALWFWGPYRSDWICCPSSASCSSVANTILPLTYLGQVLQGELVAPLKKYGQKCDAKSAQRVSSSYNSCNPPLLHLQHNIPVVGQAGDVWCIST